VARAGGGGGMHTGFWWRKPKERFHLINVNMEGRKCMWSYISSMRGRGLVESDPGYE
jgi:hypothetical protein